LPELPEVETTRRGILPHVNKQRVTNIVVRQEKLRWPVTPSLSDELTGQTFRTIDRRGKYLLLGTDAGTLLIHLGMSGSLRIVDSNREIGKHDHVDIELQDGHILRYTDPRRFGCILWQSSNIESHPLLQSLGPEPLSDDFCGRYLFTRSRKRTVPIKSFIMDSRVVVGVGNIYANEALFLAGISPIRGAGKISLARYQRLAQCIKRVLEQAIEAGGTTLRDFTGSDGAPGYFKQSLQVYGRGGLECSACNKALKEIRLNQRSTVYCVHCQR
jgi:formamidopyrimidine-DNA glycosylase